MTEYIDREEAKTAMMQQYKSCDEYDTEKAIMYAINTISKMPAADVVPVVHGRWIGIEYDGYADGFPVWDKFECSV